MDVLLIKYSLSSNQRTSNGVGLPPHTRGILELDSLRIKADGITPAYAGNAFESDHIVLNFWDRPRIRGEYNPPLRPYMSRME